MTDRGSAAGDRDDAPLRDDAERAKDLVDAPFRDDAERAEAAWLRAREDDPAAVPPSPEVAEEHARLATLLATLPEGPADERWQEGVLRAVEGEPPAASAPRWWRRPAVHWLAGAGFVAAAAAVVMIVRSAEPHALRDGWSDVSFQRGSAVRSADAGALGDKMIVPVPRGGEARVYFGARLVARCPRGPACVAGAGDAQRIELLLEAPGKYDVIRVSGGRASLPDVPMNEWIAAARAAGRQLKLEERQVH